MLKFLEHRIADKRILALIRKWLKAGALEQGKWAASEEGTPQGSSISPLLSNLYLHFVLDLWLWVQTAGSCFGTMAEVVSVSEKAGLDLVR